MQHRARVYVALALSLSLGCSCSTAPPETDASADVLLDTSHDAPLPPGDPGRILSVPETAAFHLPTLESDVQVVYTELGVPHVFAANEHDLRVVQGYLAGRDRFFQITLYRYNGLGEVSRLVGDGALSTDLAARSRGYREVAERLCASLTPEQEMRMDAYAEGVNAYIDDVRTGAAPPPGEFVTFRLLLAATSVADAMPRVDRMALCGVAATIVYQTGFERDDVYASQAEDAIRARFVGDPFETLRREGALADVLGRVDPVHPVTSAECAGPMPCYGLELGTAMTRSDHGLHRMPFAPPLPGLEPTMVARALDSLERLGIHPPRGVDFGSNAWAVSSAGTTDGSSVFAADGHLALSVPTLIFYQLGLDTRVFGDEATGRRQLGMGIPGIIPMGPGTNGHVVWSQTYLEADASDWYREEIVLDAAGLPAFSRFANAGGTLEDRALVRIDEPYEIANVAALMSVGRTETIPRWTTFDGRHLLGIEGRTPAEGEVPGTGESLVYMDGQPVIPGDLDGDGVVSGLSLDYLAFDASNVLAMIDVFGEATTVEDMGEATRRNAGYTQNFLFADDTGSVMYTAYNATPCRDYLRPAGSTTGWAPGGNPQRVLDGTRFGGFTIPLDANGFPDETAGASDPSRCIIPFDRWPRSIDPDRGFVLTANNDLAGTSLDGDLSNDALYLGGPWAVGYRADTIHDALAGMVATDGASVDAMATLQADHQSRVGQQYVPLLHDAVERARTLAASTDPLDPDEARLAALYESDAAGLDEAMMRLDTWLGRGAIGHSGVTTFYEPDGATHGDDAVATMIHVEWFRNLIARIFDDEDIDLAFDFDPRTLRLGTLRRIFDGRDAANPEMLASFNAATGESIFFDVRGTAPVERSDEALVGALVDALVTLRAPSADPGLGGFGTTDMSAWIWGLRHQVRFESILKIYAGDVMGVDLLAGSFKIDTGRLPLADSFPPGDPREGLSWFPRPGDFDDVDAANPSFDRSGDYTYAYGPNMRMVVQLHDGVVRGQNILPGGQSGRTMSPHFDDQAALWLGNDAIPLRYTVEEIVTGAEGREAFHPM
jgi:penicillin amidase